MCWECWFSCRILRNKDSGWKLNWHNWILLRRLNLAWFEQTTFLLSTKTLSDRKQLILHCHNTGMGLVRYYCCTNHGILRLADSQLLKVPPKTAQNNDQESISTCYYRGCSIFLILPSHICIHLKHTGARRGTCCLVLSQTSSQPLHGTYCAQKD